MALDSHRQRLDGALEVHAFNRDIDDINDRINEKVIDYRLTGGQRILTKGHIAVILLAKAREYDFTGIGLCVCLSVCLSVTTITKKIVDGFVPNFMGRFQGGKGRPSSCFVTIGRVMWK